ncbi:NINE protein [Rhodococcus sp. 24CO]
MNKYPDPAESGDSSNSQSPVPPQFGSPFDYEATADASLSETSAPTEKTPSTETTGTGPGWDTYAGMGNGPGWGSHPIYPPPAGSEPTTAFPASSDPTAANPTAAYPLSEPAPPNYQPPSNEQPTYQQSYQQQSYPPPADGPVYGVPADQSANPYAAPPVQGYTAPPQNPGYGQQPYAQPFGYVDPSAPFGRDPITGQPFSDKSKVTAGLLGILLGGFGAGRFYLNQPGTAIAQIAVTWLTCGIGGIWPLVDGIMMLTGSVKDKYGRPLRS